MPLQLLVRFIHRQQMANFILLWFVWGLADRLVPMQFLSFLSSFSVFMFVQIFSGQDSTQIEFSDYVNGPVFQESDLPHCPVFSLI